jgi:NADH-quinone oxidoreductase subunit L
MPVQVPHGATEYALIAGAVVIAALGLVAGYRATLAAPIPTAREAPPERGFAGILFHKYYVDELYHAFIVRPLVGISRFILWRFVDQGIIDGAGVNGSATIARGLGWIGSRLQSGQLGLYVIVFLVGAVWLVHSVIR